MHKNRIYQHYQKNIHVLILLCFYSFLSSCSSRLPETSMTTPDHKTQQERNQQMQLLSQWEITGKIAFLDKKKRQSANLFWQHNNNEQRLNLTTYLGINLMELKSHDNIYTIEVSGKTYQSNDLDTLIYQLTGFQLPTQALNYWLKGLPYSPNDKINFYQTTLLPKKLTSVFNSQDWQIDYQGYKLFNGHQLATKITIKQKDLTIKIVINNWNL